MKFKKNARIETDDLFYDLTDGGYINLQDILEEPDLTAVYDAIQVLVEFRDEAEEKGILEYK